MSEVSKRKSCGDCHWCRPFEGDAHWCRLMKDFTRCGDYPCRLFSAKIQVV